MNEQAEFKMNVSICKVAKMYLSDEQIERNYQDACKLILPKGCVYDERLMKKVTLQCRKMMLSQIPQNALTLQQKIFIKKKWGIDIDALEFCN